MRKLTLILLLPTLQFVIAVILLGWGHRTPPPRGLDTIYVPTVSFSVFRD